MSEPPATPSDDKPVARRDPEYVLDDHRAGGMQLRREMGSGVRLMGASQIVGQVARVVMVLVLTQLLEPAEFGIVSLVMVVTGFFDRVLGDTGTTSAIVQRPLLNHGLASSVFWWNVTIGSATSAFFFALSTPLARLLGNTDAAQLVRVVGLLALINSFGHVQRGLLRRLRRFGSLASVNLINALATAASTIVFAAMGWGEWALVIGNITGSALSISLAWVLSSWRPGLIYSRKRLREISGFSTNLSIQNIFGYITFAGDRFLVGRFLGATALGHYGLANRLLRYPLQTSSQTYREVVFPTLARLQGDPAKMLRTYVRTVNGIAFVLLPVCLSIAALAQPLTRAVLGPKWIPSANVIAIMALVGALQSLATTTGSIYLATGRTDLSLRWQMGSSLVMMIAYSVGSIWGIEGVAWGFFVGIALLTYPAFRIPLSLIDGRPTDALRPVAPTFAASAVAAGGAYAASWWIERGGGSSWASLLAGAAVAIGCYGAYVLIARPQAMRDLGSALAGRRGGRRRSR